MDRERKEVTGSQAWWPLPVIPALQMLMQDQEFVASPGLHTETLKQKKEECWERG